MSTKPLALLARLGFSAKGVLYGVVGVLAFLAVGIAARGIVFGVVGWYLIQAGITGRASQTADSAKAIRIAASWPEPLGSWILAAVGAGLLAYGVFQGLNAKYRTIRT